MYRFGVVLALLTCSSAGLVMSQVSLVAGDTVRVTVLGTKGRVAGIVERFTGDGLVLRRADGGEELLAGERILAVSTLRGRKPATGTGAAVGAGLGTALGVGVAVALMSDSWLVSGPEAFVVVPVTALAGALAGAFLGTFARAPRWVWGVPPKPTGPAPGKRASVGITLSPGAESTWLAGIRIR